ncbi:nitrate- and nitrite sensing domain-containing protein [Streptomyces sp. GD-15H]|uniref:nitrate- and nitrite sensing domain-containing protein n=1 Tax=Streptomyces sp. GD-15H TaxID=3129112 RepID=UPI003251CF42
MSVTGELRPLARLQGVYEDFDTPVDTAIGQIRIERRLAATYSGAGHRTSATLDRREQQRRTDRAANAMRHAIRDGEGDRLSGRQRQVLDTMVGAAGELEELRHRFLSRGISWDRAVDAYGALVEPGRRPVRPHRTAGRAARAEGADRRRTRPSAGVRLP